MAFERFLKMFEQDKKRTRKVNITLVEKEGKRKVSGTVTHGDVPYFVSDDGDIKGHILCVDDFNYLIPDKMGGDVGV